MGNLAYYTKDERQRLDAFKQSLPAVREYVHQTLEAILDDEGIRESCERLLRGMRATQILAWSWTGSEGRVTLMIRKVNGLRKLLDSGTKESF